jgi:hypothetical protein
MPGEIILPGLAFISGQMRGSTYSMTDADVIRVGAAALSLLNLHPFAERAVLFGLTGGHRFREFAVDRGFVPAQ